MLISSANNNSIINRRLRFSSDADIVRLTNARIIIIIINPYKLIHTNMRDRTGFSHFLRNLARKRCRSILTTLEPAWSQNVMTRRTALPAAVGHTLCSLVTNGQKHNMAIM